MASNEKPDHNLGAVFDAHVKAEFVDKDVAKTMATMRGALRNPCSDDDGRNGPGAGRELLPRLFRRPLAGRR